MKAAILSVGTELLFGQVVNTNAAYLSKELNSMGIDVMYHYTVGDNPARLADMIHMSFKDCDLVITTGGLGPTQDDMTKEIACQVLGDKLVEDKKVLEELEERLKAFGKDLVVTFNNYKQAMVPSRGVIFHNENGSAPGFALGDPEEKKFIICLPGPPREMTAMFKTSAASWLEKLVDSAMVYKEIRMFGIGESELETRLLPLIDGQTDPTLATYVKNGECSVRIASKRATKEEASAAVDEMIEKVNGYIGDFVYSLDNEELVQVVGRKLLEKNITISCAESCTGGMFAAALTDVPGISAVFDRGIVTYSNKAKMEELGVKEETLAAHGAVSEETAMEMAEGIRRVSGSDIGISVTGIAGPGGGTPEKPVGLVYIGFVYGDKKICKKIDRRITDRSANRRHSLLTMLNIINKEI